MPPELSKKEIAFDLKVKKLKRFFTPYTKAYKKLSDFFRKNHYEHRQGSVYCSINKITNYDALDLIRKLKHQNPWIVECLNEMDVTNVGNLHRVTNYIK